MLKLVRILAKIYQKITSLDFWENVAVAILLPLYLAIFKPKYAFQKTVIFLKKTPKMAVCAARWFLATRPRKITASIIIILFVFTPLYYFFFASRTAAWWNDEWIYRKALTIDHTQVAGNLTDFPVLVSLTETDFINHAQSDGDDFVFTDYGGTILKHEIESYNSGTGALVAWVKIPSLSSSLDTNIFMYYGNGTVSSQEDPENVWDSNFIGVYHMTETSGDFKDSTAYHNDGSDYVSATGKTGKIGSGQQWDGADDYVDLFDTLADDVIDEHGTISAWIYRSESDPGHNMPVLDIMGNGSSNEIYLYYNDSSPDNWTIKHVGNYTGRTAMTDDTSGIPQNTWGYLVGSWTQSLYDTKYGFIYVNGSSETGWSMANIVNSWTPGVEVEKLKMGSNQNGINNWNGYLDEVRVSKVARTHEWVETEYNNQYDPSGFFTSVGDEEQNLGLILYWNFNEGNDSVVQDETLRGYDGTITGADVETDDCVSGKCLYFDGDGDEVDAGDVEL